VRSQLPAAQALAALAAAGTPVLLLHGDGDSFVPIANSVALASRLAAATSAAKHQLVVMRGVGHCPQEEAPAAFVDAVAAFLDQHLAS
jgi:pimeloyl-ACP methyl ester carboxylesterase